MTSTASSTCGPPSTSSTASQATAPPAPLDPHGLLRSSAVLATVAALASMFGVSRRALRVLLHNADARYVRHWPSSATLYLVDDARRAVAAELPQLGPWAETHARAEASAASRQRSAESVKATPPTARRTTPAPEVIIRLRRGSR